MTSFSSNSLLLKIQLTWYLFVFFVGILQSTVKTAKIAFLSIFFLCLLVLSGELFVLTKSQQRTPGVLNQSMFSEGRGVKMSFFTRQEAEKELSKWVSIYQQQPTQRDVLLNITQLYSSLGEENQAQFYLQQAKKTDPNNVLFQQIAQN